MDIRKTILYRFGIFYVLIIIFALSVAGSAILVQYDGSWSAKEKRLDVKEVVIDARRGNICANDGRPLATSVPYYELRMDLGAPGVKHVFDKKVDSLSICLSGLFKDKSRYAYKRDLKIAYKKGRRYYLINRKKVSFLELKEVEKFPIFRRGRNRGGLISVQENKRVYPFGSVASRTIGKMNKGAYGGIHGNIGYFGLEHAYESYLRGKDGLALKQNMSGRWLNISKVEPEDGCDLITTIDVNFQDMVMHALEEQMTKCMAESGTAILMEVETGDIMALANYGRDKQGKLIEGHKNYAIGNSGCADPGSTFKLVSLVVALDDGKVDTSTVVDTGSGVWKYKDQTIRDSDWRYGGHGEMTVKEVFEKSSNIGVAKVITKHYGRDQEAFINRVYSFGLNRPLGIGIKGEGEPYIKHPSDKYWSGISLAWISHGYELNITPMQTLTFYNAIANNGRMVKPRLVKGVSENGRVKEHFEVSVLNPKICSSETVGKARKMLEGVVERGTGKKLKSKDYKIAGKTGTAQIANKNKGYMHDGKRVYQSSFAGYFPADNPRYSCVVVVNGPKGSYYGGVVAGPVFRKISDNVYAHDLRMNNDINISEYENDIALPGHIAGRTEELSTVLDELGLLDEKIKNKSEWAETVVAEGGRMNLGDRDVEQETVPDVKGMGASDAVYILENKGLKVSIRGQGKVFSQSVRAGEHFRKGQSIVLTLTTG
jgi:cell division protein FtsI (penicillin-binding protein 3)